MVQMLKKNCLKIGRLNREHSDMHTHNLFVTYWIRDLNRLLFVNDDLS